MSCEHLVMKYASYNLNLSPRRFEWHSIENLQALHGRSATGVVDAQDTTGVWTYLEVRRFAQLRGGRWRTGRSESATLSIACAEVRTHWFDRILAHFEEYMHSALP